MAAKKKAVMKVAKKAATPAAKRATKPAVKKAAKKAARKVVKAKIKTVVNDASVQDFFRKLPDAQQRDDAVALERIFSAVTRQPARMWGSAIVGYGEYSYVGKSGRAGEFFLCGFSPRKGKFALYALGSFVNQTELLAKLGAHSIGGGCLYIKRLADVDPKVFKTLVERTYAHAKALGPTMTNPRD